MSESKNVLVIVCDRGKCICMHKLIKKIYIDSQDKARDKNTYWELWTKIVSNRDFMLEHDFRKMMSRSGLAKDDIDIV